LMLLTLPLFVASLIWLRQLRFFKAGFLLRMALLGLAGFSIYALPPLVNGLMPHSPWSFGEAWLMTFRLTKNTLLVLYARFWMGRRAMAFAVLVCYLVPTLPCLVRLRDEGNQNKPKVERFQYWIYRALRAALLLVCLWLAFDPVVSPRQILLLRFGLSLPLLSFVYLNALGVSFLAGNLWFAFQPGSRHRNRSDWLRQMSRWARRMATPALAIVVGLVTTGLIARNIRGITSANRFPLQRFGDLAVRSLTAGGGIILSDDPEKLLVFQAALSRRGERRRWLPVDTKSLPDPEYRAQLERKYPAGWLTGANRHELKPPEMMFLLGHVAQTNRLFYLHPSFGYISELFYLEPRGAVYEMKPYPKDQFNGPPMSALEADQNGKFWDEAWQTDLEPVSRACSPRYFGRPKTLETLLQYFHLNAIPSYQSQLLGEWYATALDGWGVELQRNGRWPEARRRFEQAIALNTNNLAARVNLQCNTNLQAGRKMSLAGADTVASQLGDMRQLSAIISRYGPFDSPVFCYLLGNVYRQTGLFRQSVQQLERARALAPGTLAPEFALAQLYSRWRMDDKVFEMISQLRKQTQASPAGDQVDVDLAVLEANSWLSQTNLARARNVLQSVLQRHPDDNRTLNLVLQAYLAFGDDTNALQLLSGQLVRDPNNVAALVNQAGVLIRMGNSSNAITFLNRALAITNDSLARFNRAYAYLQTGNLPAAEADYLELDKLPADAFSVHYGLAAIAKRRHDTNLAIHHLELCLSNAPPGTVKWQEARKQLDTLVPSGRKH
jgi:tetratricopeptide (TPR) repeat protein